MSVDLFAEQINVPLSQVSSFRSAIGGTATNVAVAAARLGHDAALVTKVGDDAMGGFVRAALDRFGVDSSGVATHPELATPVVFAEMNPADDPAIWFYRNPSAPDEHLTMDDIDLDLVRDVPVLWIPGSRMAFEPSASTTMDVLKARERKTHTVLDLDYRAMFWDTAEQAGVAVGPLIDDVTVAVGNRQECEVALGTGDPEQGCATHVGPRRRIGRGEDGRRRCPGRGFDRPLGCREANAGGSGEWVGFRRRLWRRVGPRFLLKWEPEKIMTYANAAGAIVASRLLCSDEMPTLAEIEIMLETGIPPERKA